MHRRNAPNTTYQKVCELCTTYARQTSTHGVIRIADSRTKLRKFVWTVIFCFALSSCMYHCSYIISRYMRFPKLTTTEEKHARELDFPALTVCNLNLLKKDFVVDQLQNFSTDNLNGGFCFQSEDDFLNQSTTKDLSDIWEKLGITRDHLRTYGHKVYDLIVQCSYNGEDCFNRSITKDLPLETERITINNYTSTRIGLCHTILLNETTWGKVRRAGQTRGLTLTLNIERDEYLNLLSPEYGVRLMVHPRNTLPTIERGGIALHPGTKTYVSIKVRKIERLPYPFGDCTKTFDESPITDFMTKVNNESVVLKQEAYTYEFCQGLCRETMLLLNCSCVDEQLQAVQKFCNPCNTTQERCKADFYERFTSDDNNLCTELCKPSCDDLRYDMMLSTSEWPNAEFQKFVLKRWPELISDFVQTGPNTANYTDINITYINQNFLRVHVFIQEMNYLFFQDVPAYSLPEMFADLGGCLGLYIGVSVISVIEALELFSNIFALFYMKFHIAFCCNSSHKATGKISDMKIPEYSQNGTNNGVQPYFLPHQDSKLYRQNSKRRSNQWTQDRLRNFGSIRSSFEDGYSEHLKEGQFRVGMCTKCIADVQSMMYRNHNFRRRKVQPSSESSLPDMFRKGYE